jgi:glycosyltransferase involved in cell wall biosynthesis
MHVTASPTVSIGVPAYNAGDYLDAALASIVAQTYADLEVIVSDNASHDETEAIGRAWAARDPRVRYERNERNLGVVGNYNRLVDLARGRYFKWSAADDVIEPSLVERSVDILDRQPETVLVAPRVTLVDATGAPLPFDAELRGYVTTYGEWKAPPVRLRDELTSDDPVRRFRAVVLRLRDSTLAAHTFALVRRAALLRTHLLEVKRATDKILLAELALMGPFEEIDEALFHWRIHPAHFGGQTSVGMMRRLDPNWSGRFELARTQQVSGYVRAVAGSDLSLIDRLRCLETIAEKLPRGVISQARWRRELRRVERVRSARP